MTQEQPAQPSGALVRRADGSLYFIPDHVWEACRLPDSAASAVQRFLDEQGDVQGFWQGSFNVAPDTGLQTFIASLTPPTQIRFDPQIVQASAQGIPSIQPYRSPGG